MYFLLCLPRSADNATSYHAKTIRVVLAQSTERPGNFASRYLFKTRQRCLGTRETAVHLPPLGRPILYTTTSQRGGV